MNKVLRQEHKFQLSYIEYRKLCARLQLYLKADPHCGADGYRVRSLYFDTMNNCDFHEKADGLEKRRKLRLRIYSPHDDFAMFEMKQKQGIYQLKRSLCVTKADAVLLSQGNYAPLLSSGEAFARECYAFMNERVYRPKAIVEYRRFAFVEKCNDIRITFDHSLMATESSTDLFNHNLSMYPVCSQSVVTLEVKYRDFLLQYIKDAVNVCNKTDVSLSKYALARSATLGLI